MENVVLRVNENIDQVLNSKYTWQQQSKNVLGFMASQLNAAILRRKIIKMLVNVRK